MPPQRKLFFFGSSQKFGVDVFAFLFYVVEEREIGLSFFSPPHRRMRPSGARILRGSDTLSFLLEGVFTFLFLPYR